MMLAVVNELMTETGFSSSLLLAAGLGVVVWVLASDRRPRP